MKSSPGTFPSAPRWALPAARAAVLLTAGAMLARTIHHVATGSDGYLALQQDDFYYYAVTARNVALHGFSSFDGFTHTNGYQPLWMAILSALAWLTGGLTPAFFVAVGVIGLAATLLAFEGMRRCAGRFFGDAWFVIPATLLLLPQLVRMIFWGMETVVILPLYPLLVARMAPIAAGREPDRREALLLGLLSALVILARLDTAIFVGLALAAWLLAGRGAPGMKLDRLLRFAIGGLPLIIYLVWNLATFGALSPISAQAKHLKVDAGFSTYFLQGLTWTWDGLATIVAVPLALILPMLPWSGIRSRGERVLLLLVPIFPILFYALLGFVSDWQLFGWYLYPIPLVMALALCQLAAVAGRLLPWPHRLLRPVATPLAALPALAIVLPLAWRQTVAWRPDPNSIYAHGGELARFARSHPGRYAMGDRAGLTALMIGRPVLHLEGLIADRRMVEHIAHDDRLNDVLAEYGIDYMIVSIYYPIEREGGAWLVSQPDPLGAGRRSHIMRGAFARPPVFTYISERDAALASPNQVPNDRSGRCYTYVFAVKGDSAAR